MIWTPGHRQGPMKNSRKRRRKICFMESKNIKKVFCFCFERVACVFVCFVVCFSFLFCCFEEEEEAAEAQTCFVCVFSDACKISNISSNRLRHSFHLEVVVLMELLKALGG